MEKYALGVDIGGTNIRAAIVGYSDNSGYRIISKLKEPASDQPVEVVCRLIDSLFSEMAKDIAGIGIAVGGLINRRDGIVMRSPNIPSLTNFNLASEIKSRHNIAIIIENDANAAAYGEKLAGVGMNFSDFVVLTLGTGIGGGIVINNELLPVAAEIGHMSINFDGQQCSCGNVGCLESYASGRAIINKTVSEIEKGAETALKESYGGNFYKIGADDIYTAALDGDSLARSILREAGKSLGIGIANIVNILSPEAIILTGGLTGAWNIYIEAALKESSKRALKELHNNIKILRSPVYDDAGIIGAAGLLLKKINIFNEGSLII